MSLSKPGKAPSMKPIRNYNAKPPKIGGGQGRKAPKLAKALGIDPSLPVHEASVKKLLSHPDKSVATAAKKLLGKY